MVHRLVLLSLVAVVFGVIVDLSAAERNSPAHDKEVAVKLRELGAVCQ